MISIYIVAAILAVNALQLVLLIRLARRVTGAERVNERLSHFAEALSLLTDTTEQGLASIATGLTEFGRKTSTRGTAKAATRRIMSAVRSGRAVSAIAADESLSESEIRLHLELGGAESRTTEAVHGALRI
jgi:hypothetical protein